MRDSLPLRRETPLFTNPHSQEGQFVKLETQDEEEQWPSFIDAVGHEVRVSKTRVYDHVPQILHWTTYRRWLDGVEEHTKVTRIALRYTFPQELAALLYYNGFEIIRPYGDWNLEPLTAASRSIIMVCRKDNFYIRAARENRDELLAALAKAPDVEPEKDDKL